MIYFATVAGTFSYFWLGWLVLFLVIEGIALKIPHKDASQQDGTLSALVWRITKANRLVFAVFTLFWAVLAIHFFVVR